MACDEFQRLCPSLAAYSSDCASTRQLNSAENSQRLCADQPVPSAAQLARAHLHMIQFQVATAAPALCSQPWMQARQTQQQSRHYCRAAEVSSIIFK
jgi:hypothetical protein